MYINVVEFCTDKVVSLRREMQQEEFLSRNMKPSKWLSSVSREACCFMLNSRQLPTCDNLQVPATWTMSLTAFVVNYSCEKCCRHRCQYFVFVLPLNSGFLCKSAIYWFHDVA